MKTDFVVQTPNFEGPLDALLSLIEKRKLYINDISLAKVTADYIQFIANNDESITNKAEFLTIASTLVLAKSKSLLPEMMTMEEEEEISELEDRLRAFQLIKEQGGVLAGIFGKQPLFFPQVTKSQTTESVFAPGTTLTKTLLAEKAQAAIVVLPEDTLPTANIEKIVSLEEEIERLERRCRKVASLSFSSAVRSGNRQDKVVLFIAILELSKTGIIRLEQSSMFSDIMIYSQ
ncbi:MAG: ScpA family protein [Candidatus Paceibacterota bacterium]